MKRAHVVWGVVSAFAFAMVDARAALRDDFAWSLPLDVPSGVPIVRINVPPAVYRDCVDPALSDLRVLNGAGEVVPYALQRPEPAVQGTATTVSVPFFPLRGAEAVSGAALQLRIEAGKTSIEVDGAQPEPATAPISGYLIHAEHIDRAMDSLTFNWPDELPDFSLNLRIEASDDLVRWRVLESSAPLARLRHGGQVFERRRVSVPATQARFWRVTPEFPEELPELTMVAATLVMDRVPQKRLQLEITGTADPEQTGVYLFDLGAQLPVDRVALVLPEVNTVAQAEFFSRRSGSEEWRLLNSASIYRIQATNGELNSETLNVPPERQRYWRVRVDQRGGGIGSRLPQLRVGWLADQLLFMTRGQGPFEVVYGNAEAVGKDAAVRLETFMPSLDATQAEIIWPSIPAVSPGEPRLAGGLERLVPLPPPGAWRLWFLWAALLAGVAVLGAVAFKLARQMREAS